MKEYVLTRTFLGAEIAVKIIRFDQDIHVSIYGGHRPHIGAVSIGCADSCRTTQFPGHKEGVVSEKWCSALLEEGFAHAVIEAGIHYDGLTPDGILDVLDLSDALLAQTIQLLKAEDPM